MISKAKSQPCCVSGPISVGLWFEKVLGQNSSESPMCWGEASILGIKKAADRFYDVQPDVRVLGTGIEPVRTFLPTGF